MVHRSHPLDLHDARAPGYCPVAGSYPDPQIPAQELALSALGDLVRIASEHRAWWARFWNVSSVSLPSAPLLEKQWFGSLYILASSHETDGQPLAVAPGIVWPKSTDRPAFRGAMTVNYNQQALYYGVHAAGHSDLAGPFYNAMLQYIPRGKKDAASQFQVRGINMNCEVFHWGQSASGVGDQGQRSNAALSAVIFANHWLWTRDISWLNTTGWPFLDQVAEFWEDYLTKYGLNHPGTPNGTYSSVNDCFNELCSSDPSMVNVNPHITLSLLRFLFPVFIDAATALKLDTPRVALWAHLHEHLAPLPLVTLPSGGVIFGGIQGSTNHPPAGENPLNVYLGWPGFDAALGSDGGLRKVLVDTLEYMQSWDCGNCWPQYPAARVRMQDKARDANTTWHTVQQVLAATIAENLIVADGKGNYITAMEGAAGIGIVNEMLLASHDPKGIILFPQVPLGHPAAFQDLRAQGGYSITASLNPSGEVSGVVVTNVGGEMRPGTLSMLSPWGRGQIAVLKIPTRVPREVLMGDGGYFSFTSVPGESFIVQPSAA